MLPAALSPAGRSPQSRARFQARLLSVLLHFQYEAGLYLSPLPKLANWTEDSEGTADSWAPRAEQDGAGRKAVCSDAVVERGEQHAHGLQAAKQTHVLCC